jgi:hypothetical protein
MADVTSPSIALVFVIKMSEKHQYTLPSAIKVKNRQKTVTTEKKLDVISQHKKGKQTVDTCCNVRFPHGSVGTIHDNADRITESAKSGAKVTV